MNNELELFYILPHITNYNSGGNYRNDDTGCIDYSEPCLIICRGSSLFFDSKEQLLNYFYENAHKTIPVVYRIKYIDSYKGLDDVIKITDLSNNATTYHTMLNQYKCAYYNEEKSESCGKDVWEQYPSYISSEKFSVKDIYEELKKRGIKIKSNVDKIKYFEFIGDPFYREEREKMKNKQLILYRTHPINFW